MHLTLNLYFIKSFANFSDKELYKHILLSKKFLIKLLQLIWGYKIENPKNK